MKVLAFGSFDVVHPGHLNFFRQAKQHGNHLTVVVARDDTIKQVKGHIPKNNELARIKKLEHIPLIDDILLGRIEDKFKILEELKPDIIVLGYDQVTFAENLESELSKRNLSAEIIRLKPYREDMYKSSKLN